MGSHPWWLFKPNPLHIWMLVALFRDSSQAKAGLDRDAEIHGMVMPNSPAKLDIPALPVEDEFFHAGDQTAQPDIPIDDPSALQVQQLDKEDVETSLVPPPDVPHTKIETSITMASTVSKRPLEGSQELDIEYDADEDTSFEYSTQTITSVVTITSALPSPQSSTLASSNGASVALTSTSMVTLSHSGTTTTSPVLVTYDPSHTKIRRCILGCETVTIRPTGTVTTTSIVTVVPLTLPCSLVICPPCGCTTQFVSITGCPFITTATPPNSTVTVKAAATITFFTVTTTVTTCIPSACIPSFVTVGEEDPMLTTVTQFSTQKIFVTPTTSSSTTEAPPGPPGPPLTTIDPGCPCGYNEDVASETEEPDCPGSTRIPPDCPCQSQDAPPVAQNGPCAEAQPRCAAGDCAQIHYFNKISQSGSAEQPAKASGPKGKCPMANPNKPCKLCRPAGHPVTANTFVAPAAPMALTRTIESGICSTYIVCNPTQFSCPAQVTGLSQLSSFLADQDLHAGKIPGVAPANVVGHTEVQSYLGADGKEHPISGEAKVLEGRPEPIANGVGPREPVDADKTTGQAQAPHHPSTPQKIKGIKKYSPELEAGKMKAVSHNGANGLSDSGLQSTILCGIVFLGLFVLS